MLRGELTGMNGSLRKEVIHIILERGHSPGLAVLGFGPVLALLVLWGEGLSLSPLCPMCIVSGPEKLERVPNLGARTASTMSTSCAPPTTAELTALSNSAFLEPRKTRKTLRFFRRSILGTGH